MPTPTPLLGSTTKPLASILPVLPLLPLASILPVLPLLPLASILPVLLLPLFASPVARRFLHRCTTRLPFQRRRICQAQPRVTATLGGIRFAACALSLGRPPPYHTIPCSAPPCSIRLSRPPRHCDLTVVCLLRLGMSIYWLALALASSPPSRSTHLTLSRSASRVRLCTIPKKKKTHTTPRCASFIFFFLLFALHSETPTKKKEERRK